MFKLIVSFFVLFFVFTADAKTKSYRWINQKDLTDNLSVILNKLNQESGMNLSAADFLEFEKTTLAKFKFATHLQLFDGIPHQGAMIRTWADQKTGELIQMEAHLEDANTQKSRILSFQSRNLNFKSLIKSLDTMKYVREVVSQSLFDKTIRDVSSKDQWSGNDLQRVITVVGKRGIHTIVVSHFTKQVVTTAFKGFPKADLDALVYPIYEETEKEHKLQERIPVKLKNISNLRKLAQNDPYLSLKERRYLYSKYDLFLGNTEQGQLKGYWSFEWLLSKAAALIKELPWVENTLESGGGMYLEGKYATVSLHPGVAQMTGVKFPLNYSGQMNFLTADVVVDGKMDWEIIPGSTYRGQLLTDANSALVRPAVRLKDHNVVEYINGGFDEIQVYYAIDKLMESLHNMGFSDPELSTRPFHAILYDPDIAMKDNAYYWNDTINFTTYSPDALNYARDNSTIWHELGHGIMDRLMGNLITLADSGGLAEGMADFIAMLVVEDVTQNQEFDGKKDFRIVNQIGFHLTNESHDDGEAYGGAMNDILNAAISFYGPKIGVWKVADLTMDAMRLARNHPALTANDWFERMLFADQLGTPGVRNPGELNQLIIRPLLARNFNMDNSTTADFKINVDGKGALTDSSLGSRYNPYIVKSSAAHLLQLNLKSSSSFKFNYPVKIELSYNGGPLQGAVNWIGESEGAKELILNEESDLAEVKVGATGSCDRVNQEDGSCSDFIYMKVFNAGDSLPVAKKRFYMRVYPAK